jgi:diguanylate cyclase (GGDEF)-like protein
VAARLRRSLRRVDTVARLGGDEFGIIPQGALDDAGMKRLADKVTAIFQSPIDLDDGAAEVSLSIGGALYPRDAAEPRFLVGRADAAMYHAKNNQLAFATFTTGMATGQTGAEAPA